MNNLPARVMLANGAHGPVQPLSDGSSTPASHALDPDETLRLLGASSTGLGSHAAAERLAQYGRNAIARERPDGALVAYRVRARCPAPLLSAKFLLPTRHDIDAKLIAGAFIFGVGWGLGGYCPGSGIVSLARGSIPALAFVSAMLMGMATTVNAETLLARRQAAKYNAKTPDAPLSRGHAASS
jgi:hypothetical protein